MWKEVFPCLYRQNWPIATLMLKMDTAAPLECSFFVKMIKQMLDCIFFILQRHKVRWNALQRTSSLKNLTEERVLKRTQKVSSFYFVSLSLKLKWKSVYQQPWEPQKYQTNKFPGSSVHEVERSVEASLPVHVLAVLPLHADVHGSVGVAFDLETEAGDNTSHLLTWDETPHQPSC